jgi:hypothetical protein
VMDAPNALGAVLVLGQWRSIPGAPQRRGDASNGPVAERIDRL